MWVEEGMGEAKKEAGWLSDARGTRGGGAHHAVGVNLELESVCEQKWKGDGVLESI